MNLMSCRGFFKDINYAVISQCPKRILEYYFSKGFTILEYNANNLEKSTNELNQIIHAEEADHSEES